MSQNGDDKWKVIGITSFGNNCGKSGWPGIYTKVSSYVEWIESYMNERQWSME